MLQRWWNQPGQIPLALKEVELALRVQIHWIPKMDLETSYVLDQFANAFLSPAILYAIPFLQNALFLYLGQ